MRAVAPCRGAREFGHWNGGGAATSGKTMKVSATLLMLLLLAVAASPSAALRHPKPTGSACPVRPVRQTTHFESAAVCCASCMDRLGCLAHPAVDQVCGQNVPGNQRFDYPLGCVTKAAEPDAECECLREGGIPAVRKPVCGADLVTYGMFPSSLARQSIAVICRDPASFPAATETVCLRAISDLV